MNKKKELKKLIIEKVFLKAKDVKISNRNGSFKKQGWIFDFRRILMNQKYAQIISEIFWEENKKKYPFQLSSLEVAGIPLVVNLSNYIFNTGKEDMNGFFIRKSRKKDGLLKMIEGEIQEDKKIILVDDIINSGKSFIRQIEVLEELGYKISEVWAVLRMKDLDFYEYFHKKDIKINSILELNDFQELNLKNLSSQETKMPEYPFEIIWKFSSPEPNYNYVVNKSNPVADKNKIYFGSDSGYFWAINKKDGSVSWKFKVGFHAKGKSIFSDPVIYKNLIIFGSYDGNLYALDKESGRKIWVNLEADWIGSSPTISEKLGLGFVGLEFGLWKKRGGIMAFDLKTGKLQWKDRTISYTHSSPLYLEETKEVVIGSNDGIVRLYDGKTGKKKWEFKTGEISEDEVYVGFSKIDIKEGFAYDSKNDLLYFGNINGEFFALNRKKGKEVWKFKAHFGFNSTPLFYNGRIYASSLDKHLYCLDGKTGEEIWKWNAGARIFASPTLIKNSIFIGANTGRMIELNPETGKEISFITVPERITGKMIYDDRTDEYFLPTFANEIYKLKKK